MTASRAQAFDTTLFRVISHDTGVGAPGPLSADYAFGLGADPFNDNVFPMPGGFWRWPGNLDYGGGRLGAAESWFQNRLIAMSSPPAASLKVQAMNLSGIGGNGCGAFDNLFLQDPLWNGSSFGALGNMAWVREVVGASNSILQTSGFGGVEYARKTYFPNGQSPMVPGLGQLGQAMRDSENLYNSTAGGPVQVRSLGGFGDLEQLLTAVQNGASAQWVTHWANDTSVPAAGDGPTWWIDVDSRFGRFQPAAGLQAYQSTGSVFGAWGWKLWATDGTTFPASVPLLDIDGNRALVNGAVLPVFYEVDIDLAAAGGTSYTLVPARPGYAFVPSRYVAKLVSTVGAGPAAGNPTTTVGNAPGGTNWSGAAAGTFFLSAAQINQGVGAFGSTNIAGSQVSGAVSNSAVTITMGAPTTGFSSVICRAGVIGVWMAQ